MTTITIERKRLEQALEVIVANTVGAEDIEDTLRAALAAPAHQEQLKPGECWPERIMKQWDEMRDLISKGDKSSLPRDWFESLAEMRLIDAPTTAWHDAPAIQYPPLPIVAALLHSDGYWTSVAGGPLRPKPDNFSNKEVFTADQMRAYVDADRAQPATAPAHTEAEASKT